MPVTTNNFQITSLNNLRLWVSVIFGLSLVSCQSEDAKMGNAIVGKWEVFGTELNNIPNGLMQNGYFDFLDNGHVSSNIFSDSLSHAFQIEEGVLKIEGPQSLELKIARMQNDSMCLEGQLGHYFMRYYLVKRQF